MVHYERALCQEMFQTILAMAVSLGFLSQVEGEFLSLKTTHISDTRPRGSRLPVTWTRLPWKLAFASFHRKEATSGPTSCDPDEPVQWLAWLEKQHEYWGVQPTALLLDLGSSQQDRNEHIPSCNLNILFLYPQIGGQLSLLIKETSLCTEGEPLLKTKIGQNIENKWSCSTQFQLIPLQTIPCT